MSHVFTEAHSILLMSFIARSSYYECTIDRFDISMSFDNFHGANDVIIVM